MGVGESSIKNKYPSYDKHEFRVWEEDMERTKQIYFKEENNIYRDFLKKDLGDLYDKIKIIFHRESRPFDKEVGFEIETDSEKFYYRIFPSTDLDNLNNMIKKRLEEHFSLKNNELKTTL